MRRTKTSWVKIFAFSLAILILLPGIVSAPTPAYMWITGESQGDIKGSITEAGREGAIKVYAMEHEVIVPTDDRGSPTGKHVNRPLTITKTIDKSSPLLHQALATGERLSDVEIKFFRMTPAGTEEHYYTVKLEDALVISIRSWFPNVFEEGSEAFGHMEDVAFTYNKIIWTWEPGGIEAEDSSVFGRA